MSSKAGQKSLAFACSNSFRHCPGRRKPAFLASNYCSGTSVAANYRAVCRSRSGAEFVARIGVVVEEIDETVLWLELMIESGVLPLARLVPLQQEANELFAIL